MKKKMRIMDMVLMVLLIYVCFTFVKQQYTMHRIENDIKEATKKLQTTTENNQKLQDEVKMSKTDMYIEKLARERLGLVKEGETPVLDSGTKK